MERRAAYLELRAQGRKLSGYAATFGVKTRINDFTESILPGAFQKSLSTSKDMLALVDHDPTRVLARTRSGTLRLNEDSRGLEFDLNLPNTSYANDVLELITRNDAGGMSFGFHMTEERWDGDHRELRAVDLVEISVVSAFPAYGGTTVMARSRPGPVFARVLARRRYIESIVR